MSKKANGNGAKVDVGSYVRISFHSATTPDERARALKDLGEGFAKCAGKNGGAIIVAIKPDAHAEDGVYCVRISGNMSQAQASALGQHRV